MKMYNLWAAETFSFFSFKIDTVLSHSHLSYDVEMYFKKTNFKPPTRLFKHENFKYDQFEIWMRGIWLYFSLIIQIAQS